MPNTRSDGARSTGAAIATVTIAARARDRGDLSDAAGQR